MNKESTNQTCQLLSAKALGDMLSLSKRQIFRLNSCGKLPKPLRIGGSVRWLEIIAKHSGLDYPELVEKYEKELMDKHLLMGRRLNPEYVSLGDHFRLSKLGYQFCSYIEKYDEESNEEI